VVDGTAVLRGFGFEEEEDLKKLERPEDLWWVGGACTVDSDE